MPSFRTFGSVVSEEKMFEKVYGRTDGRTDDDGRKVIAIAHRPERSGELKKLKQEVSLSTRGSQEPEAPLTRIILLINQFIM